MNLKLTQWKLQPLASTGFVGTEVSRNSYDDSGWHRVSIPNSLVGNYVESGELPDPYIGLAMKDIPGYKHGRTVHFAFHRMPDGSPFRKSFWYRTSFVVKTASESQKTWIALDGLNFRATLWVNGKRVAGDTALCGTYRRYDLDISFWISEGTNTIAIELTPQEPDDLGMSFIDWSPVPSDDSAGIWQPVTVYQTGLVAIKNPAVRTVFNADFTIANLVLEATLENRSKDHQKVKLNVSLCGITIAIPLELRSLESKMITLSKENFPSLTVENPELWWPWNMGDQPLFDASFSIHLNDKISDQKTVSFGFRSITAKINEHESLHFSVNGKPILIRGTAWSPDLLLRQDHDKERIDLAYLKQMNFNTVRLEGKLASDQFWDMCDREGILVLAGWECCTHWEQWDKWKPDDYEVARQSQRSQLQRLRNHASFAAWFYGSDFPPIEPVEKMYLSELESLAPDLVKVSSAAAFPSTLTGPSGVKMSGPYGYVPPSYWYTPEMPGFAISFNTETGPDSSFPRYETVCRMIPDESQRFVGSESWNHHAGLASFITTEVMNSNLEKRYGVDRNDLKAFLAASQINSYECWRGMYEAYGRFYPKGTGVIGWMMNGHWPSLIWQMYDYWMFPTGGFFGARNACRDIHLQYSYDDHSVWLVNNSQKTFKGSASIEIWSEQGERIHQEFITISANPMERHPIQNPNYPDSRLYFLVLKLFTPANELIDRNVYWLSNTVELFKANREPHEWYYRPLIKATDYSPLMQLHHTILHCTLDKSPEHYTITIHNSGKSSAVSVLIDCIDSEQNPVPSILWSDNYLMIMPNETVHISADLRFTNLSTINGIRVSCINSEDQWL